MISQHFSISNIGHLIIGNVSGVASTLCVDSIEFIPTGKLVMRALKCFVAALTFNSCLCVDLGCSKMRRSDTSV